MFFDKLKEKMTKTKESFSESINSLFSVFTKVDEELLEELLDTLVMADVGLTTSEYNIDELRDRIKKKKIVQPEKVKEELKDVLAALLTFDNEEISKNTIIMVVGVNGVGKTTTIGKLANYYKNKRKSVLVCAADTFRAAAVEQLELWANKTNVELVKKEEGTDPASVIFEATSVAKGMSVFCGKLGEKIASDIVNAVDDGTNLNAWGSINVDDEGTPSKCNVLIENGILKSYLVDKRNSKIMNHPITGNSRRESYKFQTTSRMTNTYFLNGKSTFDEIIANTKYGLFAKEMGGGSVNPATGEFNFAVNVGYLIEDGKITKPVKGATLVGSGRDVLLRIDMIGDNLSCGHGMCGSMSGSVPTNVGQPTIRVSSMTVGGSGKGGNK